MGQQQNAKQKNKDEHAAFFDAHGAFHEPAAGTEEGACLIRHEGKYIENNSCSYRWQGLEKAKLQPGRAAYDAHRREAYHIGGKGGGPVSPERFKEMQRSSGFGASRIKSITSKKGKKFEIVKVNNFTTGFAPYGNQVHHVLNISSLRKGIEEVAKIHYPIRRVIISGLLAAKYNVNHKDNSLILPTKDEHCRQTGLPKHYGSHPAYSEEILDLVKEALLPYKRIAKQMKGNKKHDAPKPENVRGSLERISNKVYGEVISTAETNRASNTAATKVNDLRPKQMLGV
jgi:hypothetical protein